MSSAAYSRDEAGEDHARPDSPSRPRPGPPRRTRRRPTLPGCIPSWVTPKPSPVAGYFNPNLVHLVRHTSVLSGIGD